MALSVLVCSLRAAEAAERLKALDAALQGGVLTQEEYERKRAEVVGASANEKLKALDEALRAGVITEAEYQQKKAGIHAGAVPTTGDPAATPPAPADKHAGKTYRHPTGVSFWYPADWLVQELEGVVQLVPPGAGQTAETYEAYFVTGERVAEEGITRADDPRVIQYLDEQMAGLGMQVGVLFQRSGQPRAIAAGPGAGQGVRLDWKAESAAGPLQAYAMAVILGEYGLVLAAVGVKDLAAKRDPDALRIFTSFGVGEGKKDPALVGAWSLRSTYAVQNDSAWETAYSRAKSVSETTTTLRFAADGRWTRRSDSHTIAGAGGVWLESKDSKSSQGRWNADDGRLFMLWDDQSYQDYRYRLEGNELHVLSGSKGETWSRTE
jgi:hypothetical protein